MDGGGVLGVYLHEDVYCIWYVYSYAYIYIIPICIHIHSCFFFCSLHAHDFKSELLWVYFCCFKHAPVLIFTLPIANRTGHLVEKMPIPAMLAFPRLCLNAPPSVERHPLMQQKPERRAVSGKIILEVWCFLDVSSVVSYNRAYGFLNTHSKTNMEAKNGGLEDVFPFLI